MPNASAALEEIGSNGDGAAGLLSLEQCAKVAKAVRDAGVLVKRIEALEGGAATCELVQDTLLAALETLAEESGLPAAQAFGDLVCDEFARVAAISGNIERDDYDVSQRTLSDGTTKEVRKRIRGGNVKELVRALKTSIPIAKLLAVDRDVREYLLYCAIDVMTKLQRQIQIPENALYREMTRDEWVARGQELAGKRVAKYSVTPEDVPDPIRIRGAGEGSSGGLQQQRRVAGGSIRGEIREQEGDSEMSGVPVHHLAFLCAATAHHYGASVTSVLARKGDTLMSDSVDKRYLTPL